MQYISYIFFRLLIFSYKLTPFFVLYFYSDIAYFLLYKVFKYRVKIVRNNLLNSFPEKSSSEILKIEKKFYKNLSDITLEGIKGFSMSKNTLLKRYKVINPEFAEKYYNENRSIIGIGSHYANWEWGVLSFSLQFKHKAFGLYKPLTNKYIDNFVRKSRAAWGMNLIPIKETVKFMTMKLDKPAVYFMVSDQNPSNKNRAIKIDFLNQETYCLHGAEKYSKLNNFPVIYGDVKRIKRGYYEIVLSLITESPQQTSEGEITESFMKYLEDIIKAKPQDWLWSHKRWKK